MDLPIASVETNVDGDTTKTSCRVLPFIKVLYIGSRFIYLNRNEICIWQLKSHFPLPDKSIYVHH